MECWWLSVGSYWQAWTIPSFMLMTCTGILVIRAWVLWDINRKWRSHFIALSVTGILLVILFEAIYLRSLTCMFYWKVLRQITHTKRISCFWWGAIPSWMSNQIRLLDCIWGISFSHHDGNEWVDAQLLTLGVLKQLNLCSRHNFTHSETPLLLWVVTYCICKSLSPSNDWHLWKSIGQQLCVSTLWWPRWSGTVSVNSSNCECYHWSLFRKGIFYYACLLSKC